MGYRQQRPKIGLTVCPDLVDHYISLMMLGGEGGETEMYRCLRLKLLLKNSIHSY